MATYDRKMLWFDLDFSSEPYQTLRLHGTAVRGVAFHKHYPLFASGADDRGLIVSHGMVYKLVKHCVPTIYCVSILFTIYCFNESTERLFVSFSDLTKNPLIVPLKKLVNHESVGDFGIFDVIFHPKQPWVFSAGADSTIRLYS